jgi:hypothetical protein
MQLVDLVRVLLADGATPVDQDPQHLPLVVADHGPQPGHPGPDERDRVCVGGVGLAALPGREHGGPSRQLRRDADDVLAGDDEPVVTLRLCGSMLITTGPSSTFITLSLHLGPASWSSAEGTATSGSAFPSSALSGPAVPEPAHAK